MTEQILFVDDEPNVLQSIQRTLRKRYSLKTARSGKQALEMIATEGPFAVIVSDMQMPEMNGAELLSHVKKSAPNTVRMMLTGNADQQTAIDAINHGDILRFLNKPTSAEGIANALDAGLAQYRLIQAEQELLQNTLRGSIQALTDILSLASPEVFGRCSRLKVSVANIAKNLNLDNVWEFETMAMLSQAGCVSLQTELVERVLVGGKISDEDSQEFWTHAGAGADLIAKIPRMERIAEAIRYQGKYYDGSGFPEVRLSGEDIPIGSRILRLALDQDSLELSGYSTAESVKRMTLSNHLYDPEVFAALKKSVSNSSSRVMANVAIAELRSTMQLADDLFTSTGTLLVAKGQATTSSVQGHLQNYHKKGLIDGEITVWIQS